MMAIVDGAGAQPEKKGLLPPRIYTNTYENMCRSVERLARWVLRNDVSAEQVSKARASKGFMQIRVDLEKILVDRERLALSREQFDWEKRIETRLQAIEDSIAEEG